MTITALKTSLRAKGLYDGPFDEAMNAACLQGLAEFVTDRAAPSGIGALLEKWLPVGHIQGRTLITAFLAHASAESNLQPVAENLNYSIEALISKFGRHRISIEDAHKFGRLDKLTAGRKTTIRAAKQEALANILYGGEWGRENLGNLAPGDGWKHRGAGIMQNTGLLAHIESGKVVGMDFGAHPELLLTLEGAVAGAVGFWVWKGLNRIVMQPGDTTVAETHAINGGENGLAERRLIKTRLRALWLP